MRRLRPTCFKTRFGLATTVALVMGFGLSAVSHAQVAPKVVVTSKPIHSLVAQVMAGVGEPHLLIRGGQSPHTFAMKPSDASALQGARVVVRISSAIEPFSDRAFAALPKATVKLSLGTLPELKTLPQRQDATFERHKHGHGHGKSHGHDHGKGEALRPIDGHVWLDPANAKLMVDAIAGTLADTDPTNAERYRANAQAAKSRLDALDAELGPLLQPVANKPLVVLHDALQYFEARYGLNVVGSIQLSTEVPPSGRRLSEVRSKISQLQAVCVFREPMVDSRVVDVVTEKTPARVGELDPEGTKLEPGVALYDALLRGLARSIVACAGATT